MFAFSLKSHMWRLQKKKPIAFLEIATGFAVNVASQWLAYPLLPPAHGLSVALQ